MELQLKNIGMIKEANVKIDGLTVIAGENDTGKSTLGKALYLIVNACHYNGENFTPNEKYKKGVLIVAFHQQRKRIFQVDFVDGMLLTLKSQKVEHSFSKKNGQYISTGKSINKKEHDIVFIETPLVWNFTDFFRDIAQVESQMRIELDYPYLMKDLNFKLHIKSASKGLDIKKEVTNLMGGEFKKDEMGRYYFDKKGQRIELVNTASGIKYFGLFQILSQNNYLNEKTVLILDEPEVHLHPKWQLEMAKIIVELVQNGVKIVVNSHSPYMIEALERYGEKSKITMDFYLAEDGYIDKVENNNSLTLAKIFNKLSAPYETFNQMDSEILHDG